MDGIRGMRPAIYLALIGVICTLPLTGHGEIYRVVDPVTGKVTFTDNPPADHKNAEKLDLRAPNTQPPTAVPEENATNGEQAAAPGYQSIEILQPENDATVPPGQLDVVVQIAITPELRDGDQVRLLINGKPQGAPASTTTLVIRELIRGSHRIEAQIVSSTGKVLKTSDPATIHVKRASIKNNPS